MVGPLFLLDREITTVGTMIRFPNFCIAEFPKIRNDDFRAIVLFQVEVRMANVKPSGGHTFSKTCLVRDQEDQGRQAILREGRENSWVAPIGPDGLTMDGGVKIPTSELVDVRPVDDAPLARETSVPGVMGDRGTITIPSDFRRALRLRPGSPVLIEMRDDEIRIQPAEIKPRDSGATTSLDDLVARITPENRHEEISTGPACGLEVE